MIILGILPKTHKRIKKFKQGWRTANFCIEEESYCDWDNDAKDSFNFIHMVSRKIQAAFYYARMDINCKIQKNIYLK